MACLFTCKKLFPGSIKIWDFGSGQCIKEKQGRASDEDLSITGLVYSKLDDDRVLIASGWNNKLKILLVSARSYYRLLFFLLKLFSSFIVRILTSPKTKMAHFIVLLLNLVWLLRKETMLKSIPLTNNYWAQRENILLKETMGVFDGVWTYTLTDSPLFTSLTYIKHCTIMPLIDLCCW